MLRQLRSAEKMKKVLWIGLIILVVPSLIAFYGFGQGGGGTARNQQVIATIDYPEGEKGEITPSDLSTAKNVLQGRLGAYAQDQGIMLNQQGVSELATEKAVIDQAINLDILRHFAEVNNLVVGVDETIASIQQNTTPEQRQMIEQQLARQGRNLDSMLQDEAHARTLGRASEAIGAQARATHYEAWQEYENQNEQLVLDTYKISTADLISSVTVTTDGLTAYYNENKENFRVPDQVQYEYVIVRKDDLKSSVTVSEDEITSYYTANKEEFRLPRKVEASQIFLKLPNPQEMNTTSAAAFTSMTEAVTAKADEAYERAAKGEDFAALASSMSEEENFPPRADEGTTASDSATTAGGNLGLISEEVAKSWYGDSWTSAVFAMKEGGITKPIRTDNMGYAIVQVRKIVEGEIQPLDQVRPIVENKLRDQKVEPLFEAAGERMTEIAGNVTGLQQIASATSQTVLTSDKVGKADKFIKGIGLLGDFESSIADLEKGGHSDVLSDSQRHLVIQIKEEFPSHVPELDAVKARVEQAYRQKLAEDQARTNAEELLKKSTNFEAFTKALADMGTTYTHSKPFKRPEAASIFGGMVEDFAKSSAGVKEGDIKMSTVGRAGQQQAFVVWHVAQIVEPSKTDFAKELGEISDRITNRKRQVMVLEYIREQRKKLEDRIEINEAFR